nr:reverse transcriptase domain-containing protein [Tanacetum cinerariifolium]
DSQTVNQQTSAVTIVMTAILKQFQATPPPASVKAVEEICVTCGGAHPYYQCLAAGGNTFLELRDNIQGYVSAAAFNYNQGNSIYRPPGMANQIRPPGFAQPNVQNNQNRFGPPQDLTESSPNPTSSNPNHRNCKRSKQPFILEESPIDTIADQHTMAELLRAPTEGYAEVIVVPPILVEHFELKHSLINMLTSDQFFGLEKDNPHDHIHWFNKITSTIKYKDVPNSAIKHLLFPFSFAGAARHWLEKEPRHSILIWEDLVSKFINELFPPSRTTNLQNEISNFQQRFDESFHEAWDRYKDLLDSLNSATSGNLLERHAQDVLMIIENKSKCLPADGNTFLEFRDNTQGYVSAAAINYNQGNSGYHPPRPLPSNTIVNPKGELKATTTRSGLVLYGPFVPVPPPFINPEEDERVEETLTDLKLTEYTIKVPLPLVQKAKSPSQRNYVKMLKALLSNKEKLLELENTPLNENCSAVILKKLPEKLGDPGKFLISCGFSELKCKALADIGASINFMPLSIWKTLGLPELISTRRTLELANRAICTPARIARDVFVLVGKFTFSADFFIVDCESNPRVPLIFGRPFLRTARSLIDVHGEEMILCNGCNISHFQVIPDII